MGQFSNSYYSGGMSLDWINWSTRRRPTWIQSTLKLQTECTCNAKPRIKLGMTELYTSRTLYCLYSVFIYLILLFIFTHLSIFQTDQFNFPVSQLHCFLRLSNAEWAAGGFASVDTWFGCAKILLQFLVGSSIWGSTAVAHSWAFHAHHSTAKLCSQGIFRLLGIIEVILL